MVSASRRDHVAVDGRLWAPGAVERFGRVHWLERTHVGGHPARHTIIGAGVGVRQEHVLRVVREIDIDDVAARALRAAAFRRPLERKHLASIEGRRGRYMNWCIEWCANAVLDDSEMDLFISLHMQSPLD
jgi:hypothetical protein